MKMSPLIRHLVEWIMQQDEHRSGILIVQDRKVLRDHQQEGKIERVLAIRSATGHSTLRITVSDQRSGQVFRMAYHGPARFVESPMVRSAR